MIFLQLPAVQAFDYGGMGDFGGYNINWGAMDYAAAPDFYGYGDGGGAGAWADAVARVSEAAVNVLQNGVQQAVNPQTITAAYQHTTQEVVTDGVIGMLQSGLGGMAGVAVGDALRNAQDAHYDNMAQIEAAQEALNRASQAGNK
jgi:hypothetical protein